MYSEVPTYIHPSSKASATDNLCLPYRHCFYMCQEQPHFSQNIFCCMSRNNRRRSNRKPEEYINHSCSIIARGSQDNPCPHYRMADLYNSCWHIQWTMGRQNYPCKKFEGCKGRFRCKETGKDTDCSTCRPGDRSRCCRSTI